MSFNQLNGCNLSPRHMPLLSITSNSSITLIRLVCYDVLRIK
uniref:Uncharacterized protein n=1 Tax=viral metagenome TaxID=1070528 RepID=A0A6C0BMQ2_9ZZZZ